MGQSKYTKRTRSVRRVASGTAAGGGSLRLQLNRDFLTAEHRVNVAVSQANSGTDPTSVDVRDFISTVALETSDGRRVFLTGPHAYDLARLTESASSVTSSLGATSTASYSFELHHENDGALLDLLTALRSNEYSTIDLVVTFAVDSANGFKGQTNPAAAAYTVSVDAFDYEMLTETQFGQLLGSAKHFSDKLGSKTGTAAGSLPDLDLLTGCLVRFVAFHAYDTTGVATLANTVLDAANLRLNVNGHDYLVCTGFDIRQDNVARRGFDQTGVYVVDFGDDEAGWLALRNVQQARMTLEAAGASVPAGFRIDVCQDYTRAANQ